MSRVLYLYPASPLGFSEAGRAFYGDVYLPMLRRVGFAILDPWTLTPQEMIDEILHLSFGQEQREAWAKANQVIGENNQRGIERSDIVAALLDGVDVDSGTASEVGYAAALGKAIEGYRGDFRLSADNYGATVNLQVEHWIRLGGGIVCTSLVAFEQRLALRYERLQSGRDRRTKTP